MLCLNALILRMQFYRNEVHIKHKSDEVDDDDDKGGCEMEYLRNILYEYMMGKQPMVSKKITY